MRVMVSAVYSRPKKRGEMPQRISETYAEIPTEVMAKLYSEELAARHPEHKEAIFEAYKALASDPNRKK